MDDKRVCRLCLNLINDMWESLEDMRKGMLAVIVPEFNLDLACKPNVLCYKCSKLLVDLYEFKSACIENSWRQRCESNEENLEDTEKLNKDSSEILKCCLCLKEHGKEFGEDSLLDMKLRKCLPELEVCLTSKICDKCRPLLEMLFTFITACLYAESKITGYISLKNWDKTVEINLYEIYDHYSFKTLEDEEVNDEDSSFAAQHDECVDSERQLENDELVSDANTEEEGFPMEMEDSQFEDSSRVASENATNHVLRQKESQNCSTSQPVTASTGDHSETRNGTSQVPAHIYKIVELEGVPTFLCKSCEFKTRYKHSMLRHIVAHKGIFACEFCSFTTDNKATLCQHVLTHPESNLPKKSAAPSAGVVLKKETMYICKKCPFKTKFKQNLTWHTLTHKYESLVKPLLTCSKCNFQTRFERSLKAHEKKGHHRS